MENLSNIMLSVFFSFPIWLFVAVLALVIAGISKLIVRIFSSSTTYNGKYYLDSVIVIVGTIILNYVLTAFTDKINYHYRSLVQIGLLFLTLVIIEIIYKVIVRKNKLIYPIVEIIVALAFFWIINSFLTSVSNNLQTIFT